MRSIVRVAVVDDHPLYRQGVISLLSSAVDFEVVGEGASATDAVEIAREHRPDAILLDLSMPGGGLTAVQKIAEAKTAKRIIVLTVSEDITHVTTAMRSGAAGYILKGVTGDELLTIVRQIHLDARYVSPGLAASIFLQQTKDTEPSARGGVGSLTPRELQIMGLVARGLTNKEIGRSLLLSEKTVKHHMTSIMQKLNARNRIEVTLIASGREGSDLNSTTGVDMSHRRPSTRQLIS